MTRGNQYPKDAPVVDFLMEMGHRTGTICDISDVGMIRIAGDGFIYTADPHWAEPKTPFAVRMLATAWKLWDANAVRP